MGSSYLSNVRMRTLRLLIFSLVILHVYGRGGRGGGGRGGGGRGGGGRSIFSWSRSSSSSSRSSRSSSSSSSSSTSRFGGRPTASSPFGGSRWSVSGSSSSRSVKPIIQRVNTVRMETRSGTRFSNPSNLDRELRRGTIRKTLGLGVAAGFVGGTFFGSRLASYSVYHRYRKYQYLRYIHGFHSEYDDYSYGYYNDYYDRQHHRGSLRRGLL